MESDGIREPSRPGIREDWRPNVGCREGGRERKSKMILVWMLAGTFDQERRQGEKHVLRERWNIEFQTLWFPGVLGIQVERSGSSPPRMCAVMSDSL